MIRAFHASDTETIIDIWYQASIHAHDFVPASFWEKERQNIREIYIPMAQTFVIERDSKAVGFISLLEPNEVGGLFVLPDWQGHGLGRQLIEHAATLKGSLVLNVFKQNHAARRFYERLGFVPTGEGIEPNTGCEEIHLRRE